MLVRVAVLTAVVGSPALIELVPFIGLAAAGGSLALVWAARSNRGSQERSPELTNPFRLAQAIKFGALYALVLLVVRAAQEWVGSAGVMVASLLAGLTDVDAITLSLGSAAGDTLSVDLAVLGIATAALANTVAKAAYGAWLGDAVFRRVLLVSLAAAFAGGVVGLVIAGVGVAW